MRPPRSRKFTVPRDYTFTPGGILIHESAFKRLLKLIEKAQKRDPDAHGMYIYNDFFGFGILDLVDETLTSAHTHVAKKRYLDAWYVLDALAHFVEVFDDWTQVDDGEQVCLAEQARGALTVTTIRGLEAAGQLNERTIPNLEGSLSMMAGWAEAMADTLDTSYHIVLKGYGKKLFGDRTEEERKLIREAEAKAYKTFVQSLSPDQREKRGDRIDSKGSKRNKNGDGDDDEDKNEESKDEEGKDNGPKVWFGDAKATDADMKDRSFRVSPTWKAYRDYTRGDSDSSCTPVEWDLTQWTEKEKKDLKKRGLRF